MPDNLCSCNPYCVVNGVKGKEDKGKKAGLLTIPVQISQRTYFLSSNAFWFSRVNSPSESHHMVLGSRLLLGNCSETNRPDPQTVKAFSSNNVATMVSWPRDVIAN